MALAVSAFAENEPVTLCHNPNDPHLITVSGKGKAADTHQEHDGGAGAQCDDDNGDGLD
jgi:hypothetical protein